VAALRFALDVCLDAAAADAALTGRLFPGAIVNLLVDLLYGVVNPRMRGGGH
jgi:hypothetical protein